MQRFHGFVCALVLVALVVGGSPAAGAAAGDPPRETGAAAAASVETSDPDVLGPLGPAASRDGDVLGLPVGEAAQAEEAALSSLEPLVPDKLIGDAELRSVELEGAGNASWGLVHYDETTSRVFAWVDSVSFVFSAEGVLLHRRVMPDSSWMAVGHGAVFVVNNGNILQLDPLTLATVNTITPPVAVHRPGMAGSRLWYGTGQRLFAFDVATGITAETSLSGIASASELPHAVTVDGSPHHQDRVIVEIGEQYLLDVGGSDPTLVLETPSYLHFKSHGRVFSQFREHDIVTGALLPDGASASPDMHLLHNSNLFIDPEGGLQFIDAITRQHYGGTTPNLRVVAMASNTGESRGYLLRSSGQLTTVDLAPRILETDEPLYMPEISGTLNISGLALGPILDIRVNGVSRPFHWRGGVMSIDLDPNDSAPSGLVEVETPVGVASHHINRNPPRGQAAVVVHLDRIGERDPESAGSFGGFNILCPTSDTGTGGSRDVLRFDLDDVAVVVIPAQQVCTALSYGDLGFGFLPDGGPYSPATDPLDSTDFRSGGVTHFGARALEDDEEPPLWIYVSNTGNPPPGVRYTVEVTCPTWSQTILLVGNDSYRLRTPAGESYATDCSATLGGAPGATVVSYDAGSGLHERTFPLAFSRTSKFVVFSVDHGGSDPWTTAVVGVPGEDVGVRADAGAIQIFPTFLSGEVDPAADQLLWQGVGGMFGVPEAGDRFGEAITKGDFNNDGWPDIAVGAPGEGIGPKNDAGMVTILFGGSDGYRGDRSQHLHQDVPDVPGVAEPGDGFGSALTTVDYNSDGIDDLAVGVPGEAIGPIAAAGLVQVFYGSSGGLVALGSEMITQATPGIFGNVEAGDRFGQALAGHGSFLAIGSPGEGIGSTPEAGMVHLVDGTTYQSVPIWQSFQGRGARGAPEPFDHFGAVLDLTDYWLVVGVPDEDIGAVPNAGAIEILGRDLYSLNVWSVQLLVQQDLPSRGYPEADDRFGASIDLQHTVRREAFMLTAAPGEDLGHGLVHLVKLDGNRNRESREWNLWWQGQPSVGDVAEGGDFFGSQVRFGPGGTLLASAPGEDGGAGAVFVTTTGNSWTRLMQGTGGVSGARESHDRLGSTLSG